MRQLGNRGALLGRIEVLRYKDGFAQFVLCFFSLHELETLGRIAVSVARGLLRMPEDGCNHVWGKLQTECRALISQVYHEGIPINLLENSVIDTCLAGTQHPAQA